jgi:hypothetical protein
LISYHSAEKDNSYGASNHDCIATNFRVARYCKLKKEANRCCYLRKFEKISNLSKLVVLKVCFENTQFEIYSPKVQNFILTQLAFSFFDLLISY